VVDIIRESLSLIDFNAEYSLTSAIFYAFYFLVKTFYFVFVMLIRWYSVPGNVSYVDLSVRLFHFFFSQSHQLLDFLTRLLLAF
jgi:hypothetical protein